MKTTINISLIITIVVVIIFSCKKKDDSTPPPASTTTGTSTTGANPSGQTFTAQVNGNNFSVGNAPFGPLFYKYNNHPERGLGAQSSNDTPYTVIRLFFMPAIGTFSLTQSGAYRATYSRSGEFFFFTSKTGTINITSFDTSGVKSPYIDKLKCTFSFVTDSMSSQSHTITNGYVDFVHP